jgi:hypothetical protein
MQRPPNAKLRIAQHYCKFTNSSLNLQSSLGIVPEEEVTCKVPIEAVHILHLLACPAEKKCLQKYLTDYKSTIPEVDIYIYIHSFVCPAPKW